MPQSASRETLSPQEQRTLLTIARETISARLESREAVYPEVSETLRRRQGAFVTLYKSVDPPTDRKSGHCLRGCIGYIDRSFQLADTVKRAAIGSAFHDTRFPPLSAGELNLIHIEISVLSPFQKIDSKDLVVPGVHGVVIRHAGRSGLLLPQVATEFGWNRDELLVHLCRKAGLSASVLQAPDTEIETFTAFVFGEEDVEPAPPI
ncbi:MAG TPA: AmmeMemoRadiSam system protein A [Spirochaetia bacterium]|nr:AmmeMemoRadiSam system protein A [Spirochaetia bacterium]